MKKFVFENLQDVTKLIPLASDAKSATVLTLGAKAIENRLMCVIRSNTQNRQIVLRTLCDQPKDWDGKPIQLSVRSANFISVIQTLAAYKDAKMYLAVGETDVTIGVEKKAKVKLPLLGEFSKEIKVGKVMAQFIAGDGFETCLRKGCGCARQSIDSVRLFHNAVLVLNTKTGELSALSTDGFSMASAKTTVQPFRAAEGNDAAKKRAEEIAANLKAFCEGDARQSEEALELCVPHESMTIIRQLISGVKNVGVAADESHLLVQAGPNVVLTVARGTGTTINIPVLGQLFERQGDVVCAADVETFLRGVSLCNKVKGISPDADGAMSIEVTKDALVMSVGSGKNKAAETRVALLGKTGEATQVKVDGKKLETILSMLDKGGMLVRFSDNQVMLFSNGNLKDGSDETAHLALALVRDHAENNREEEVKDPEETEGSEGTEAMTEGIAA